MNDISPEADRDLDVIFGEFRDRQIVQSFVHAVRDAEFTGTLYIGYPVLAIDDGRVEFDAVLVSRDRGVIIFDLYSYSGGDLGQPKGAPISIEVRTRQEQLYAALFNKLNSFRELRRGRSLVVEILTVTVHPITDTFAEENDSRLVGLDRLPD